MFQNHTFRDNKKSVSKSPIDNLGMLQALYACFETLILKRTYKERLKRYKKGISRCTLEKVR